MAKAPGPVAGQGPGASIAGGASLAMFRRSRHKAEAYVTPTDTAMIWQVTFPKGPPTAELARTIEDVSNRAAMAGQVRRLTPARGAIAVTPFGIDTARFASARAPISSSNSMSRGVRDCGVFTCFRRPRNMI